MPGMSVDPRQGKGSKGLSSESEMTTRMDSRMHSIQGWQ